MKTLPTIQALKNSGQPESAKKQKSYYEQFLQMLIRKTSAEKRAQLYGNDPFKK
jgi:hypothetical protein